MSFDRPWMLLSLVVVPAALAVYVLLLRRPGRAAVRYPNVEIAALVAASSRSWRSVAAPALLVLAPT